jgi:hypothetical protein
MRASDGKEKLLPAAAVLHLIKYHLCLVPPGNRTIYTTRLVEVLNLCATNCPEPLGADATGQRICNWEPEPMHAHATPSSRVARMLLCCLVA